MVENSSLRQEVVRFVVEEAFVGVEGKYVTITSFTDLCGYHFRKGVRYLVDAYRSSADGSGKSDLGVGMCGLTDRAEYAADSIRFLKTLRQNPNGAIIFGTVKQYVKGSTFVSLNNKPISGASVLLQDPLHGDKKETAVDSTGWYEFVGLPEGVYTHSVQTPIGFTGVFQHTIEVRANGCAQVDVRGHSNNEQLAHQK